MRRGVVGVEPHRFAIAGLGAAQLPGHVKLAPEVHVCVGEPRVQFERALVGFPRLLGG